MKINNKPRQLAVSFAESGDKNPIPDKTSQKIKEAGNASWETGFPPLTMTPIAAGGIPPHGKDMNGIIHELSDAVRFSQSGGLYPFNQAFADAIKGYPKGAILLSADGTKVWWNTLDENDTDPDSDEAKDWKNLLTDPNGLFLQQNKNLADLQNKGEGRKNLEVYSRSESDRQFADSSNNFAAKRGVERKLTGDTKPTSPGVWSVENSKWTPESWGTLLYTTNRADLKADTGSGQFHHYLFLGHSRKLWVATNVNGNWSDWQLQLDTRGGTVTGDLTANYYAIPAGVVPEGSGAYAAQLDTKAPFYQANFDWDVNEGGHYVPLVKGRSNRKGQGYPTAVSFGYLLDGTPDFAHPCIHVKADNAEALWRFNPSNGSITSKAGTVATQEWVNTHCPFPVGYVMLMGNGNDPNALYPGTRWQDLNATGFDGRVISLGYDAMAIGGTNKVTIGAHNLPDHSHRGGMNAPGNEYGRTYTGTDNTGGYKLGITSHTYTNASGAEIVRNEPIDITNAYVHVRGWLRTA